MKLSFAFFISFLALHLFASAAGAVPSSLRNCNLQGWDVRRLGEKDSVQFIKKETGCIADFKISPETPKINDGWRAELEDPLRMPIGSTATYEFSTLIPGTLRGPDKPNLVLAQWHDNKPDNVGPQRPPFSIRLRGNQIVMPLFNQKILDQQGKEGLGLNLYAAAATYDRWVQWRVRIFWALDDKGMIEVWKDGLVVAYYRGYVGYLTDLTAPYFKIGIYTTESFDHELQVFHTQFNRTYFAPSPLATTR